MNRLLDFLPRGLTVDDEEWERRHRFLLWILVAMAPALAVFGLATGNGPALTGGIVAVPVLTAAAGWLASGRRARSLCVTAGMTACCAGLVILSGGMIEAHFSFFVIIGFLTLYQHWVPFVWNIAFTTISHGLGSALVPTLMFNHHMGQMDPWLWSTIHGLAVLAACAGVMMFCRITEDEQGRRAALTEQLAAARVRQQEFTSELLLNLARRNQSMFGRQLDIINDLEEREHDPDTLAELFRLDHLATRVRRNAESLLVLSGEQPARVWSAPVPLRDVVRAGIAETEDLERVRITVDEGPRVVGSAVADLTHLLAELAENAVRFSSPATPVTVHSRPSQRSAGAQLLIVEDTGIGMPPDDLAAANELLAQAQEVDLAASRRLGFHVVSRLAERHGIEASLTPTPGGGVTAVLVLPAELFAVASGEDADDTVPTTSFAAPSLDDTAGIPVRVADGGRHAWPGRAEPGEAEESEAPEQAEPADEPRPAARHASRGLIHPMVVPPPAPDPEPAPGPAPDSTAPAPRRSPEGPPVLKRRVPQTHLAPELIRPAPVAAVPSRVGTASRDALSAYQASRRAARTALDDDPSPEHRPTEEPS